MRLGALVQTIKNFDGGLNKKAGTVVSMKKLEEVGEGEGGGSGAKDRGGSEVEYEVERVSTLILLTTSGSMEFKRLFLEFNRLFFETHPNNCYRNTQTPNCHLMSLTKQQHLLPFTSSMADLTNQLISPPSTLPPFPRPTYPPSSTTSPRPRLPSRLRRHRLQDTLAIAEQYSFGTTTSIIAGDRP
ncbi:hypothetical protein C1H46_024297 [Malus baccata]|uniref:Uncharacterized protein n=1 Tax=Malus baccata TaxID=106549 RepID=A0A540LUF0_MALBA|nr:hypothetical protein C1H46_024297 [Malus baccata]